MPKRDRKVSFADDHANKKDLIKETSHKSRLNIPMISKDQDMSCSKNKKLKNCSNSRSKKQRKSVQRSKFPTTTTPGNLHFAIKI